jgi:Carboxypeptidase regulatory-like domain/TonB-dependent Receptor Plug Domain
MRRRSFLAMPGAAAIAFFLPALLPAQQTSGSIGGRVFDGSGAAIADAMITATQTETGSSRTAKSSADGAYSFPDLPIGPYRLSAAHPGFKKAVEDGLTLHVSEHASFNFTLQVGEITQEVSVVATAEQVQSENGDQSGLISGEQVRDLQLNGRSFMTLLELLPGVASNMSDRTDPNSTPDVSINGARSSASAFNIDGGNNADVIVGSSSMNTFTSVETIAEFSVVTSPYSAEYGRGGFSQVNLVTKGGTRQIRGSLFYFLRNDAFDASDFFSHQTLPLKLNNFGYTIGGPVRLRRKGGDPKTFFFWAQEWNRITTAPVAVNTTVPTPQERAGDFRPLGPGRDGAYGTTDDPVTDPANANRGFPNGVIPAARIDANSRKLMDLYPAPNFAGPGAINYTSAAASRQTFREESARLDRTFNDSFKIYGRYTQDAFSLTNPYGGTGLASVTTRFPGLATTSGDRPGKNFVLNGFHNIRPSLFQQFQITFARRFYDLHPVSDIANKDKLGITLPELFPENDGRVIPGISLGSNYATLSPYHVGHKELINLEFGDNFSKIYRTHAIKFGALYSYGGNLEQPNNVNTGGTFSFSTNFAKNPVANFLLGYPNTYTEVERPVVSDARFGLFEAFVQDDWRATRNLTLCFGLRYTNYYNPYDLRDVMSNFIPSLWDRNKAPQLVRANGTLVPNTGDPLNGIIVQGRNSPLGDRIANDNKNLFGPRFSFAWSPSGSRKTVIRGGWGLFYTRPLIGTFINNAFDNPPFSRTVTLNLPSYALLGGTSPAQTPPTVTALGLPLKAPTAHRFSFGVQRELMRNTILDVSYVGTRSLRLMRPEAINNPLAGTVPSGTNVNFVRPYAGWGAITSRDTDGGAIYHSLQVSFNRRIRGKLIGGFAYTWSKSIDDGSSDRGTGDIPPDSQYTRAQRGPSDFDRTHIFTGNFIWTLPAPIGSPFFRGWQLSGIVRVWTGTPFDVIMSSDVAGIGSVENQRPNVIADTRGPRTAEEWFNRDAFARPKTGTFGNMGRNSLRGPGVNKWDMALFKNFRVAERSQLQFRGEFFNILNHPSFTTVGMSLNTTAAAVNPTLNSFAVVTGTRDARVMQVALKVYF